MGVVSALLTGAVLVLTGCEPADGDRASGGEAEASTTSVSPSPSATATATANGVERLRPAQILARARAATLAARSLRVHGRGMAARSWVSTCGTTVGRGRPER